MSSSRRRWPGWIRRGREIGVVECGRRADDRHRHRRPQRLHPARARAGWPTPQARRVRRGRARRSRVGRRRDVRTTRTLRSNTKLRVRGVSSGSTTRSIAWLARCRGEPSRSITSATVLPPPSRQKSVGVPIGGLREPVEEEREERLRRRSSRAAALAEAAVLGDDACVDLRHVEHRGRVRGPHVGHRRRRDARRGHGERRISASKAGAASWVRRADPSLPRRAVPGCPQRHVAVIGVGAHRQNVHVAGSARGLPPLPRHCGARRRRVGPARCVRA